MLQKVINFLVLIGMWTPENRDKYDFVLSPEMFWVTEVQICKLERFAKKLREFFEHKVAKFPTLCKVDIMVDQNYDLKIAEIDGLNKRAFGYAILERKIAKMFGHCQPNFFLGVENALREILEGKSLFVIVPGREKYYRYGFDMLISTLREVGVDAEWGFEKAALKFMKGADPAQIVLLDKLHTGYGELDRLLDSWGGEVLIPNEPFFSSKANLVDLEDPLIPKTVRMDSLSGDIPFENYVIKHTSRSGCKGVYFSQAEALKEEGPGACIVQEFVEGKEFEFSYFDGNSNLVKSGGWQVRIIVTLDLLHCEVVDADVTARQNHLVHGASDCIQVAGRREDGPYQ